jgi:hypothetical protein
MKDGSIEERRIELRERVAKGRHDNSPAFKRRGGMVDGLSPEGTAESDPILFQPSLRDLKFSPLRPGIEMPGYFQMFLRNITD